MITYGTAKKLIAKYAGTAGKCPDDESVDIFVKLVLQYLLLNGTHGNERKFHFYAERGVVTLPVELEVPLKIKIEGAVGSVWNRWFEYHSGNLLDEECLPSDAILEDPNRYPTVYDISAPVAFPAVLAACIESPDSYVIVKGLGVDGKDVYTTIDGERVPGVRLRLTKDKIHKSPIAFTKITEVYKTVTKGYVTLVGVNDDGSARKYLASYGPFETTPAYRRVRCVIQNCPAVVRVSVLGRIRLKDHYDDTDLIPFDNLYLLQTAAQTVNSMYNDDIQVGLQKDQYVKGLIETEGSYKKVNNGQPIEIFQPLSAGIIRNAGRPTRWRTYGRK